MKQEYVHGIPQVRRKIFAELECSLQLDQYIREILENRVRDQSGVLISGYKGTGKTFFAENYLQRFERVHPVLIARHYQQHEKIPYYGFKYGISDYLSKIYNQFSKKEFQKFSRSLKLHLGDSFPLLLDYIPELSLITGQPAHSQRSMLPVENQLYPLFKRLFEFLSNYSGKSVFFFTDDLQWMDASGFNLLKYLLLNLGPDKLIWIGACRASQNNVSAIRQLEDELGVNKRRIENISLKGFTVGDVRKFLEMTLGGDCHDDLVGVCYKLSGGNASHLQVLMERLKAAELLRVNNGQWCCDRDIVEARYTGQNTEGILLDGMKALSSSAHEVLCIMACMGRFNKKTILDWLKGDLVLMEKILKEGEEAGLLVIAENEIHFSDMQIGEMIYNELDDSKRVELHYRIASLLYDRDIDLLSSTEFVLMVSNFNKAIDLLKAEGKLQMAAELNYKAGKISQQENALEQARYFFKMSSDLLKECPWDEVFDQILPVYMERARVEYVLGEYDLAEIHLDYLLERIPDPVNRAKIFQLKVTINNHLGRYMKVVRILKESLAELGLELPLDEQQLSEEVNKLTAMLTVQEDGGNAENPAHNLDVESRQAILKLLYVGGMGLHHTSDVLMRWAALQIILCSGAESISGVKAIGCVSYGRMLIISGEITKGFDFGLKGLQINNTLNDISLRCRVYGVYSFYIQPWKKPFEESYSFLEKAAIAGKRSGDLIGLYIIKTHRLNLHVISGLPLKDLPNFDFESYPGRELTYYITHYQKSLLQFLMGKSPVFAMPRQEPSWLAAELTIQEEKFYRNYVWARYYFLFGHYELAELSARQADNNRKLQEGSPLLPANLFIWFLSITQNWTNYSEDASKKAKSKLEDILSSFELWQQHGPANYRPAWYLINAEYARINGDHDKAMAFYELSAASASSNIYHFALTQELWARYLLVTPEEYYNARFHLTEAIRGFSEWGAVAKAKQLTRQYQAIIPHLDFSQKHLNEEMDIETIQYELSGDMEVASLIKKLMVLLLRISGSTHVVVELVKDNGDRILNDELSLLFGANEKRGRKRTAGAPVPVSLFLMALKSQDTIIVNDLKAEKGIRDLEGMRERGVQSFLILPVTINGHLSMVIYLENIFAGNWYVPERVRWSRITANQGAVIIENARIHERSVKLNQELRKEMSEKERLASVIEAQKDAHLRALVQTQDAERKRIAGDLHDSLGSLLSTVKLRFNGLQDDFEKNIPEKTGRFRDTIKMLDDAIHELRQISHNMLPVSLRRFGLKAAIETFVEQINASQQLDTRLQILGLERRLPEDLEVAGYRICQELVQNVIKHAEATLMNIQIIDHHDSLNIIVEDNGKGMIKKDLANGFGFSTIQAKVDLFKGSFEIDSQPGRGAMVLVDLPVNG